MGSAADTGDADARPEIVDAHEGEGPDPRLRSAWRTWLSALATDAEAAMAAALAYESLPDDGRDAWLDALEADAPLLQVPKIALYAPLLAVEVSEERRARIEGALDLGEALQRARIAKDAAGGDGAEDEDSSDYAPASSSRETRALRGITADGKHVCIILAPLYLDFVQVLICRYTPHGGFITVKHDPLRHVAEVPHGASSEVDGVCVEETPLRVVVEELAHAILADRRARRDAPPALTHFAHLFGPHLDDSDREG